MIRPRRDGDLPALARVLADQQAATQYPHRWPLPGPVEDFLVRGREQAAWVAERDGAVIGHVSTQTVSEDDVFAPLWSAGHERPVSELAVVSVLFTAASARGTGVGGLLLDTAVAWIREHGLAPCLDVVPGPSPAERVYRARGWREVGRAVPPWADRPVVAMILPLA